MVRRLEDVPVVVLAGPRQCGKTTLARAVARDWRKRGHEVMFFDLEDPLDLARLDEPRLALEPLRGLVVLDEIQHRPDLFRVLRVLVDREKSRRFLVLGSASGDLLRQSSETLTGRVSFLELTPFRLGEISNEARLWLRGGFPRAYLPARRSTASQWLQDYVTTFLERDVPGLGLRIPPPQLRRAWTMLAHVTGGVLNASDLARSLGVTDKTVRSHVDVLTATFMVRQLRPWHENVAKRQVKAPKVYVRDSGVLHSLLGIRTPTELERHPRLGASFEGFALEAVLSALSVPEHEAFFWATHGGAELDLFVVRRGKRLGFELKRTDHPTMTRSMHVALADLRLDHLFIVIPGDSDFPIADRVSVRGVQTLERLADVLR